MRNRIVNIFFYLSVAILLLLTVAISLLHYYQIFKVPSSSMEPTLYPGDYIVIRKQQVPERFDIAVFTKSKNDSVFFVKRVVALPSETIEIISDTLRIDNVIVNQPFNRNIYFMVSDSTKLSEFVVDHKKSSEKDTFILNISVSKLQEMVDKVSDKQIIIYRDDRSDGIYPPHKESGFSTGRYGPLKIPQIGFSDSLTRKTRPIYQKLLLNYEGLKNINLWKKNEEPDSLIRYYHFKNNYYFFMGDNRSESFDSRFFGAVPEKRILGVVKMVLWSVDPETNMLNFNRLFKKIE